jgi:hypothetical protein
VAFAVEKVLGGVDHFELCSGDFHRGTYEMLGVGELLIDRWEHLRFLAWCFLAEVRDVFAAISVL